MGMPRGSGDSDFDSSDIETRDTAASGDQGCLPSFIEDFEEDSTLDGNQEEKDEVSDPFPNLFFQPYADEIESLKAQLENKKVNISNLEKQNKSLTAVNESLRTSLNGELKRNKSLTAEIKSLKAQLENQNGLNDNPKKTFPLLKTGITKSTSGDLHKNVLKTNFEKANFESLNTSLNEALKRNKSLTAEIKSLKAQLENQNEEENTLKEQIDDDTSGASEI